MDGLILITACIAPVLVALPLFVLSHIAQQRFAVPGWVALAMGLAALCVAGYAQFWAVWLWPPFGWFGLVGLWMGLAALLFYAPLRRPDPDVAIGAGLVLAFGFFYVLWGYWGVPAEGLFRWVAGRWTDPLPGDNELPYFFARQLAAGEVRTPFYGDWLASDRPPLQVGLYMLLVPLKIDAILAYHTVCTVLQLTCLAGVYGLARAMDASRLASLMAAVAAGICQHVAVNSVFVWPKLLAAALVCFAAALHFYGDKTTRPKFYGALAGGSVALAMLAHGGTAFAVIGIGVTALALRQIGSRLYMISGVVTALVLYLPWSLYQRFVDPPGDRLLKMHLAGVPGPEANTMSLGGAIADAYSRVTPMSFLEKIIANLWAIFMTPFEAIPTQMAHPELVKTFMNLSFFGTALGMGAFFLALYATPVIALWRKYRPIAVSILATLFLWAVLMYGPGQTVAHQGSYYTVMAAFALTGPVFTRWPLAGWLCVFFQISICLYWLNL